MKNTAIFGGSQAGEMLEYYEYLESMQKAWIAGEEYNPLSMTDSQAGRPESLDPQFVSLTYTQEHAAFWKALPKKRVDSPVLQYARKLSLGQAVTYAEGGDVGNISDQYDRQIDIVKFIGTKGEVTGTAQQTKFIVDAIAEETENKIISLITGCNLLMYHGNASLNPYEWSSVKEQVRAKCKNPNVNFIDKRGKRLSYQDIMTGNRIISKYYGNPSGRQAWTSVEALDSLVLDELENKSYITNWSNGINMERVIERGFKLGSGEGTFHYDLHASPVAPEKSVNGAPITNEAGTAFAANHSQAPNAISAVTPTVVPTTTAYALPAGTYNYAITSFNRFGESVATEYSVLVSGSGNMVSFGTITEGGSPTSGQEARGFRIYRKAGSSTDINDYRLAKTCSTSAATHYDDNKSIPGTSTLLLIDWDQKNVIEFCQQMPLYKLPYGIRKDAIEFLVKLYGTLRVKNANRIVVIENIGELPN